jgi:hypothetical protein
MLKAIGLITLVMVIFTGLIIWQGVVLQQLWDWFIVDFFGVESLPLKVAIGISLIVSVLFWKPTDVEDKDASTTTKISRVCAGFFVPLFELVTGYIVMSV